LQRIARQEVRVAVWSAVAPGTDLSRHARVLSRVHDAVIAGSPPPVPPRRVVERSWSRVLRLGLDPDRPRARDPLPLEAVEARRRRSALSLVVDELRQVLGSVADASHFLAVVTDADGVSLTLTDRDLTDRDPTDRDPTDRDPAGFTRPGGPPATALSPGPATADGGS
jgi:hypothetical protein